MLPELTAAPRGEPVALLHTCGRGRALLYTDPRDVLTVPAGRPTGAFDALERFLAANADLPCVGYLAYDLRDDVEALPVRIADDLPVPVLHFAAYRRTAEAHDLPVPPAPPAPAARELRAHTSRADYERRVAAVIEHIRAGDVFQANLTQPFTGSYDGDPRALFWRLCEQSPAPFAAYLETGEGTAVLSASPEEFLHLEGDAVRTRPIKGTRPRSQDSARDRALLDELLDSDKDLAELTMIVDLLRNDLGKRAVPGTVRVGPFPEHRSFAQVHHLFATVTARLRAGTSPVELLRATFPGGSITGAPKLRCMEILEELELVRRGVYTGAIGHIGPGPRMHLNVAIRTMTWFDGKIRCNAGGGVTADSDPAAEYDECLAKAAGLLRALQVELPGEPPSESTGNKETAP